MIAGERHASISRSLPSASADASQWLQDCIRDRPLLGRFLRPAALLGRMLSAPNDWYDSAQFHIPGFFPYDQNMPFAAIPAIFPMEQS
jgi:hypothetical protein